MKNPSVKINPHRLPKEELEIFDRKNKVTLYLLLYSLSVTAATSNEFIDLMSLQQENKKMFASLRDYCKEKTKSILTLSESKMSKVLEHTNQLYVPTGAMLSIFTTLAMLPPEKIDAAFEEIETLLNKYL
jgi:sensor c-di-GMP phosphodiesterase-like protein